MFFSFKMMGQFEPQIPNTNLDLKLFVNAGF
jgi:hypothetical protein